MPADAQKTLRPENGPTKMNQLTQQKQQQGPAPTRRNVNLSEMDERAYKVRTCAVIGYN